MIMIWLFSGGKHVFFIVYIELISQLGHKLCHSPLSPHCSSHRLFAWLGSFPNSFLNYFIILYDMNTHTVHTAGVCCLFCLSCVSFFLLLAFAVFCFFFPAALQPFYPSSSPSQWHQSHSACITLTTWGTAYSMGSVLLRRLDGLTERDMLHTSSTVCDSVGSSGLAVHIDARIFALVSPWSVSLRLLNGFDSHMSVCGCVCVNITELWMINNGNRSI